MAAVLSSGRSRADVREVVEPFLAPGSESDRAPHVLQPTTVLMVEIPWGPGGFIPLSVPRSFLETCETEVCWPNLEGVLADYGVRLDAALDDPVESPRIEERVAPGSKVALVVDDPSRWTPVGEVLPRVLQRLHQAGIDRNDVTISVGVGRHQPVSPAAMARRVGAEIAAVYRCLNPPVDEIRAYLELGTTARGIPVRVFRPVAQADLRVMIGSVLPHLQAGFGGGYKLILPGTSHRTTLGALHRQGLEGGGDVSGLLGSDPKSNPMRLAVREAASLLGPCVSVSHLIGGPGEVLRVLAGEPEAVQDRLSQEARRRFQAPAAPPVDVLVVGNHPWPGDPMQSFKVLLHHQSACRAGGILVGYFWTDPAEIERSFPARALRTIAATGTAGGWAIRQLVRHAERAAFRRGSSWAFMVRWARELVVDRDVLIYAPPLRERIGPRLGPIRIFSDQEELWRAVVAALGDRRVQPLRLRVFPQGGLTYVARSQVVGS